MRDETLQRRAAPRPGAPPTVRLFPPNQVRHGARGHDVAADESRFDATIGAMILVVLAVILGSSPGFAEATPVLRPTAQITTHQTGFDLAAMPLPAALDAFSAETGLQILYDSGLANGRRSSAVRGVMVPDEAIDKLLTGTGLRATLTKDHDFIIVSDTAAAYGPPPSDEPSAPLGTIHVDAPFLTRSRVDAFWENGLYASLVQAKLREALGRILPEVSRRCQAEFRIWVDDRGVVEKSEMVNSTADGKAKRMMLASVRGLAINRPPPIGLIQPISVHVSVIWR